ncbi:glycosyltransferase family 4 protein [Sphingobacterium paludis]|uniref:Glycosyltransferase involved in cell wall biosynthesis n=1 Tax=Sphingobacterium paludis TaxID=1476465 RepID=A0A4R7CY99_9SPHI|nr:glycosyltransferase family 1 protein [Sphingobacterium paludis]TDS11094.1 glycosyltransferase involved in cell wall biosynthesis [Sphingobacterium paludis]
MRIGYDAKRYFQNQSGLGNYSRDLLRILKEHYPTNDYVLYTTKRPSRYLDKGFTIRFPENGINKMLPSLWRSRGIATDLKNDAIDIFHGLSGEIPMNLTKQGIQSVVTIHDLIFLRHPELYKPLDRIIYAKKFKYAAKHANKVIAISMQTKMDIMHFFGIPDGQIDVIYQGCHPAFQQVKLQAHLDNIRQKYELPTDFILNVGSIEPRKNAFQIVKALEHLDVPLVMIGKETAYAEEIKKYVAEKKMQHKILFKKVERMDDLAAIYKLAKLFVYPSTYEGFGIPIIEALYSETPVITTNSGVFPEAAGPFSYYVNPKNCEEIRHAIQAVLSSTSMQEEMKTKGLEYAQQFNDDVLAEQWIKVYQELS